MLSAVHQSLLQSFVCRFKQTKHCNRQTMSIQLACGEARLWKNVCTCPFPRRQHKTPQGQNSCSIATLPIKWALGQFHAEGKSTGTILHLKYVALGITAVRLPLCV